MKHHSDTVYRRAYHNAKQTIKKLYRRRERELKLVRPEQDPDDENENPFIDDPVDEQNDEIE